MMQNNGGDGTSEREVGSGTQEAHCQTVTGGGERHPGNHRELKIHKNPPRGLNSLG